MNDEPAIEVPPSRLPVVIAALVAFAIGGGAGFLATGYIPSSTSEDETTDGEETPVEKGPVVHSLEPFTVNLRGGGGGRILRLEVQVQIPRSELALIEEQTPQLRDAVLTLASDYTYHDVEGLNGKTRLRDELHGRLNGILDGEGTIDRIYFTQFVVQ